MSPPRLAVVHMVDIQVICPMQAQRAVPLLWRSKVLRHSGVPVRRCSCSTAKGTPTDTAPRTSSDPAIPPADHRQVAASQRLFTGSVYSPGSPLFEPHGAHIFNKLVSFLRAQYRLFQFQEVITPTIYKKSLWQTSGHWENYREDMFEVKGRGASGQMANAEIGEDEEYGLKPMNCPGHCLLFKSQRRSYRDLPIRYADFGPLHRNEVSGALSGLTRVRRFHQDDGHVFCRPAQVSEEISSSLEFVAMTYKAFKLPPFRLVLSTRPQDQYIGTAEQWDRAEDALKDALIQSGRSWEISEGNGAFYGPKIDVILKDSDGKSHQTATIQLDFQLPSRFELQYVAPAPHLEAKGVLASDDSALKLKGLVTPVIIHRAVLGSLERFLALLMEHYNGWWPFWLSPRQAIVLSVNSQSQEVCDYALKVADRIKGIERSRDISDGVLLPQPMHVPSFIVDVDNSDEALGKKVSTAKRLGYNFIMVVGPQDVKKGMVGLDISGQPNQEVVKSFLQDLVGLSATTNRRAVAVTSEHVRLLFNHLSTLYE